MKPVRGLHSAAVNRALEPKNLHLQELGNEKRLAMNWTQRKGLKKKFLPPPEEDAISSPVALLESEFVFWVCIGFCISVYSNT